MEEKRLIKLEYLSILELNGKGSFELLQGQITSDMDKVSERNCVLGAICDVKGRTIGSFVTALNAERDDSFHLIGDKKVLELTMAVLEKYQPFYDTKMSIEDQYQFFGIKNDLLKDLFPESNLDNSFEDNDLFSRVHYLEKEFHIVYSTNPKLFDAFEVSLDESAWKQDEILNLNYEITSEASNKFTPHELGYHLTSRIDFEKGCYTQVKK